ncbi:hypothetical protein ACFSO9_15140 [Mesonia maritima]|uniref:hypothetical protein n=1 Tax=Mesonia maritima TaxID=1793873 RepID=UPI0036395A18
MKSITKLSLFLIFSLFLFSCESDPFEDQINEQQNEPENPTNPADKEFEKNFGIEVNRDFLGKIINKNKNPLSGVEIKIGDKTTQTNAEGIFIIKNATVFEEFAYIKASKIGFIKGSRSIIPTSGTNKVEIMLLEENVIQTISSGNEATISLPNNASVKLPGDYIDENKNAYTGDVQVIMHHLDPSNDNMNLQMPGMLYAADEIMKSKSSNLTEC